MNNKSIIFYGAFDRYNFGDNLMPIVLEEYFIRHELDHEYTFEFASIAKSDLSNFGCKQSSAINGILKNNNQNSILIVVGGEVLGASLGTLFTHVQQSISFVHLLKVIKKISPKLVNKIANIFYPCHWEYPYVPGRDHFEGRVIFNTVGGCSPDSQIERLKSASFISARDQRTHNFFTDNKIEAELVPDSVLMISDLFDHKDLVEKARDGLLESLLNQKYIVVQVCPYKKPCSEEDLAKELIRFNSCFPEYKIVLLPIGYASGHDDVIYLTRLQAIIPDITELFYDLTVWEILFAISHASAFYGTSLHGIITSMSYNVPYFSINEKIEKISSFLNTWSIAPFDNAIEFNSIAESFKLIETINMDEVKANTATRIDLIKASMNKIISTIKNGNEKPSFCSL